MAARSAFSDQLFANETASSWLSALGLGGLGSTYQPLNAELSALAALASTGNVVRTAAATYVTRTIAGTLPVSVANGDGVAGAPTISVAAMGGDGGSGGSAGVAPAPAAGDAALRKFLMASGAWAIAPLIPDVILEDQKTSGTDGGTFTSGADQTRDITTEVRDPLNLCTVATNQFTLVAGTYFIKWHAPAFGTDGHQSLLRDATGNADLARGQTAFSKNANDGFSVSMGSYAGAFAAPNKFEIRHHCTTTKTTSGFGKAGSFGTEIYTHVEVWKIA